MTAESTSLEWADKWRVVCADGAHGLRNVARQESIGQIGNLDIEAVQIAEFDCDGRRAPGRTATWCVGAGRPVGRRTGCKAVLNAPARRAGAGFWFQVGGRTPVAGGGEQMLGQGRGRRQLPVLAAQQVEGRSPEIPTRGSRPARPRPGPRPPTVATAWTMPTPALTASRTASLPPNRATRRRSVSRRPASSRAPITLRVPEPGSRPT